MRDKDLIELRFPLAYNGIDYLVTVGEHNMRVIAEGYEIKDLITLCNEGYEQQHVDFYALMTNKQHNVYSAAQSDNFKTITIVGSDGFKGTANFIHEIYEDVKVRYGELIKHNLKNVREYRDLVSKDVVNNIYVFFTIERLITPLRTKIVEILKFSRAVGVHLLFMCDKEQVVNILGRDVAAQFMCISRYKGILSML